MLKSVTHLLRLGLSQGSQKESKRKKRSGASPVQFQFKESSSVRIVHPGGREERYQYAIPASKLMEKYQGMWVARPEVFRNPRESLLYPDEDLLPGHKYLIIPSTTIKKLKHRHMRKIKGVRSAEAKDKPLQPVLCITWETTESRSKESASSAKEFYACKDNWAIGPVKKRVPQKKTFVQPLPKAVSFKASNRWEPGLTAVQELSP